MKSREYVQSAIRRVEMAVLDLETAGRLMQEVSGRRTKIVAAQADLLKIKRTMKDLR